MSVTSRASSALGLTLGAPATERLDQVITHAMAPAFLLAAVAGFVGLLIGRTNGIIDRIRAINAIPVGDNTRGHLKADLPRLKRRAKIMNDAIYLAVGSAVCTSLLLIFSFVSAFFGVRHEPGAGLMFMVALALLCASLVTLAREMRIGLTEFDHYG
jgi:hypothetical protein